METKIISNIKSTVYSGQYGMESDFADCIELQFSLKYNKNINRSRHLILCIDISDSMKGKPLEMVKNTVIAIIKMIEDKNLQLQLTIITFASDVEIIEANNSYDLIQKISNIQTSGRTDMYKALEIAYNISEFSENSKTWIGILTDGEPNKGKCTVNDFIELINKMSNIIIQAFGYGNYKIDILKSISPTYQHISNINMISNVFGAYLGEIIDTIATQCTITLPNVPRINNLGVTKCINPISSMKYIGAIKHDFLVQDIVYKLLILPSGDYVCKPMLSFWNDLQILVSYVDLDGNPCKCITNIDTSSVTGPPDEVIKFYFKQRKINIIRSLYNDYINKHNNISAIESELDKWPALVKSEIIDIRKYIELIDNGFVDARETAAAIADNNRHVSYTDNTRMTNTQKSFKGSIEQYITNEKEKNK